MIRNSLWAALGIALPLVSLAVIRHRTGWPPALPYGWLVVWGAGFIALILAVRLMDLVLKNVFARHPGAERFATGLLIGCWIFVGAYLHR